MSYSKYLNLEFIGFCIVITLCIYFYFNTEKKFNKIPLVENIKNIMKYEFGDEEYDMYSNVKRFAKNSMRTRSSHFKNPSFPKPKKKKFLKSENRCKVIFEKIFNKKFPSIRPDFLKNPITGLNLELDGYCEELKLAFEYQGAQHSKYIPHFHRTGPQEFMYQVKKDEYKAKLCKLRGIDLIHIPHYIHYDKLEEYILRTLKKIKRFSYL